MENETNKSPDLQTAIFVAETARLMAALMERIGTVEGRAGVCLPEQNGVPDVVKADISEFLHTVMEMLIALTDHVRVTELRLAAAEAVAAKNEAALASALKQLAQRVEDDRRETIEAVKALNQRVDDLSELFPVMKKMGEQMAEMTEKARARITGKKRPN
jgi:hypothetical protein